MSARATLLALAPPARRWSGRLAALFAAWALGLELATGAGFIAAVATPPGAILLVLAGLAALLAAAAAPFSAGPRSDRAARGLALAGAGLLLLAPPLSLALRETRTLQVIEGQPLPPGALPGLPPLRVGDLRLAGGGPFPLSKTVAVPLLLPDGAAVEVGLFPPARLAGWRLAVFQFGYAPALEWRDGAGRPLAAGYVMLGTLPRTEEEGRLVEWLPEPNVMMGVGTFPPKVEELIAAPGGALHLHLRLEEATLGGARRALAAPDGWRWAMDGRPADPTFAVELFEGPARRFAGTVRGGETVRLPGGQVTVARGVRLWAELQAVRDPFVELFLAGGLLVAAGGLAGLVALATRLAARRRAA
ncbi:MAG TPA: hypothetical protein VFP50_15010 [Anaeromyxobacteraceae bacterium]|nr:hypothetical protein [Anaeromyxobacteraceae bacterium]